MCRKAHAGPVGRVSAFEESRHLAVTAGLQLGWRNFSTIEIVPTKKLRKLWMAAWSFVAHTDHSKIFLRLHQIKSGEQIRSHI
jgi:hypothetical protein